MYMHGFVAFHAVLELSNHSYSLCVCTCNRPLAGKHVIDLKDMLGFVAFHAVLGLSEVV